MEATAGFIDWFPVLRRPSPLGWFFPLFFQFLFPLPTVWSEMFQIEEYLPGKPISFEMSSQAIRANSLFRYSSSLESQRTFLSWMHLISLNVSQNFAPIDSRPRSTRTPPSNGCDCEFQRNRAIFSWLAWDVSVRVGGNRFGSLENRCVTVGNRCVIGKIGAKTSATKASPCQPSLQCTRTALIFTADAIMYFI